MKLYLDLDRTLFDTARANKAMWVELARAYGLDHETEHIRMRDFYVRPQDDDMYYYDLAAHLRAHDIDPTEARDRLVASEFADNRLLLPGAQALLDRLRAAGHLPEILTFGDEYYQPLKVMLCPALHHLTVQVTDQPKYLFLADKGDCVLVDDKNLIEELPDNVRFIWVQIEGEAKSVDDPRALKSLAAVGDALGV